MGLGKTIQVIAALDKIGARAIVILCPASVKIHWARKIAEWSQRTHNIFIVMSGKDNIPPAASVIIVNYEMLLSDRIYRQLIARGKLNPYCAVVMDEAHYLKTISTKRTKRVLGRGSFLASTRYKWALTGTPILNRPAEIYPLLYTLAPQCIEPHLSWKAFGEYFCNGHDQKKCRKCGAFWGPGDVVCPRCQQKSHDKYGFNAMGHSHVGELAERMKSFMLRRKKEDVLDQLPDKVETIIELNCVQTASLDETHIASLRRILALDKVPMAASHITDVLADVDNVVVFAYHREAIQALYESLQEFNPVICYGGMNATQKQQSIDGFINDPTIRIFIAQITAGGTGVDGLQGVCNYVVFLEPDWSPGIMDQAIDRLRRIGQRNTVFVQYLTVPDSLDTMMGDVLDHKRNVISKIILAKEVIKMSLDSQLERLIVAIEAISVALGKQVLVTDTAPQPAPAAAPKSKAKAKEVVPDPVVEETKPQAPAKSGLTDDDVRSAALDFMKATPDKEGNRVLINEAIWPMFGVTSLKELQPKDYEAAIAELAKGPAAFASTSDDLSGI